MVVVDGSRETGYVGIMRAFLSACAFFASTKMGSIVEHPLVFAVVNEFARSHRTVVLNPAGENGHARVRTMYTLSTMSAAHAQHKDKP